jgi:hypothetical protein
MFSRKPANLPRSVRGHKDANGNFVNPTVVVDTAESWFWRLKVGRSILMNWRFADNQR